MRVVESFAVGRWKWAAGIVVILLMIGLRLVALDSDAYPRLSWSSGLLTDEGFYIHNARNLVLFGQEVTDDFNNMLMMPLLHYVQAAVFTLFGVGAAQARLISVIFSLCTLACFFFGLRRAFGVGAAILGSLFLGLDHINLLYNRLALMDTPAALPLAGAFAAFAAALCGIRNPDGEGAARREGRLLALCGALLVAAYVTRGLAALVFPAPLLALWQIRDGRRKRRLAAFLAGFAPALAAYILLWYLPHRAELTHMNRHYVLVQLVPENLEALHRNIFQGLFGDSRGMFPYLFRHSPVQITLALMAFAAWPRLRRTLTPESAACGLFLGGWLACCALPNLVVNYAPSRYYVLFYPAMAGCAALLAAFLPDLLRQQGDESRQDISRQDTIRGEGRAVSARNACFTGILIAFCIYEGVQFGLLRLTGWRFQTVSFAAFGVALVTACALVRAFPRYSRLLRPYAQWIPACLLVLWAAGNLYWMTDWLTRLTYRQRDADRWLAANLPPDSVMLGAVAPGLCLNNRFRAVAMIEGLCNDDRPVERFAPAPRFILILDNAWKERWWERRYPDLVRPERRIHAFPHLLRQAFVVGVYPAGSYAGRSR